MVTLSPAFAALASAVASATLAGWVIYRFQGFGPKTLRASLVVCGVSFVALQLVAPAMGWAAARGTPVLGLMLVAVPVFTFAFWSGGVLIRMYVGGLITRR